MRRIGYGNSRRQVGLLIVVPTRSMVGRTCEFKPQEGNSVVAGPQDHVLHHLIELGTGVVSKSRAPEYRIISRVAGRRGLKTVDLPRWRKERPTQTIGDGEIWLQAPGILRIKLIPIESIVAPDGLASRH